jgi:hypothetical protein
MATKDRPSGTSSKAIQSSPGEKAKADSRPAGERGIADLFTINEQGEYCFGTSCFSLRVKPGAGEVRVVVDRNECGVDAQQLVDALFGEVVKGAPTVYETKSKVDK